MDGPRFIRANTKLLPVPLVPEIRLHLAEESLPIWRKTEEELGEMNLPPPYWAFAWAGGQALARYLIDNPAIAFGAEVLDLGSGSGLTAIAAMRAGAARVLAADIDALALAAIGLNAAANAVAVEATQEDLLAAPPNEAAAASTSCSSAISSMSGRWLSACWPSSRRLAPTAQTSWSATRAAATSPRTAFARSPNTRCRSRASWRTPRSSARPCGGWRSDAHARSMRAW